MTLMHLKNNRFGQTGGGLRAVLIAAALPISMADCAAQTPVTRPQASCPVETSENADAAPPDCEEDASTSEEAAMRQSLDLLSAHGLDPGVYRSNRAGPREAWLLAATHLRLGVLDPKTLAPRVTPDRKIAASFDALPTGSGATDYRVALAAFAPSSHLYKDLQAELERLWSTVPGDRDSEALAAAEVRIASLVASLERLRWLPRETAPRQIYANIPTFEVVAFSGETEVSRHAAIFGELKRQTPEFSDFIEYLEFSPWWNIPASIAREDKLAQFRNDPGAVDRLDYRILDASGNEVDAENIDWPTLSASTFPYRIRQAPGPANALGRVKFMFPNAFSIYVHDTPDRDLFSQVKATLSAGCIRVQDALELSEWVLEGTSAWDRERIDSAVASGTATRAQLAVPLPIHIVYLTAFPAADGSMSYAQDAYGREAVVLQFLAGYSAVEALRADELLTVDRN